MTFTKEDTNIVKGIAILAMIFHHCYPNSTSIPISMLEIFHFSAAACVERKSVCCLINHSERVWSFREL